MSTRIYIVLAALTGLVILVAFGASIEGPNVLHGPLTIHNANGSYRHLRIGPNVHLGRDVLLDLTAPLVIGPGAIVSMRCTLLPHTRRLGPEHDASANDGQDIGAARSEEALPTVTVSDSQRRPRHPLAARCTRARSRV